MRFSHWQLKAQAAPAPIILHDGDPPLTSNDSTLVQKVCDIILKIISWFLKKSDHGQPWCSPRGVLSAWRRIRWHVPLRHHHLVHLDINLCKNFQRQVVIRNCIALKSIGSWIHNHSNVQSHLHHLQRPHLASLSPSQRALTPSPRCTWSFGFFSGSSWIIISNCSS